MPHSTTFVLIHSPLVGPFTWKPVANALRLQGWPVVVPPLNDDERAFQSCWEQHARSVANTLADLPLSTPLVLGGHSGAGPLLPAIRAMLPHSIIGYVFVDAGLPRDQATRLDLLARESPALAAQLHDLLAAGGRFPTWTDDQLCDVVPDAEARRRLLAELQPRPMPFFQEPLPVFAGWPDAPGMYVQFSSTYEPHTQQARAYGWPVHIFDAGHFHLLADPQAVAAVMAQFAATLTTTGT